MEKMKRPGVGALKVGDPVLIRVPGRYINDDARYRPGIVVKVARVWVTVQRESGPEYRFRLDTQGDGGQYSNGYRFVTPEQRAYDERMSAARKVLSGAGVTFNYGSPLRRDDSVTLALAECVTQLMGQVAS